MNLRAASDALSHGRMPQPDYVGNQGCDDNQGAPPGEAGEGGQRRDDQRQ
jgi:hypothetical protein